MQQIIPLPEAIEYQVQLREKEQVGRKKRAERYDVRLQFWEGLVAIARSRNTRHANIKPGTYHWLGASSGIRGLGLNYVIVQEKPWTKSTPPATLSTWIPAILRRRSCPR